MISQPKHSIARNISLVVCRFKPRMISVVVLASSSSKRTSVKSIGSYPHIACATPRKLQGAGKLRATNSLGTTGPANKCSKSDVCLGNNLNGCVPQYIRCLENQNNVSSKKAKAKKNNNQNSKKK